MSVYFNPEALAEIAMMDTDLQSGLMASVITQFVSTYETFHSEIDGQFKAGNFKTLHTSAHSLKSSSLQLGLEFLGNILFNIEQQAKAGGCDAELMKQLKEASKPSLAALNEYLQAYQKKAS